MATKKYISLSKLATFLDNLKNTFASLSHSHTIFDITDYTVDNELSSTSTNPIQNKIVDAEFEAVSNAMSALELAHDELDSAKKDKDLIVTYQKDSSAYVTHSSQEILVAVNNGQTVKFQKDTELLNLLEITADYATFYMVYVNMSGKLQQRIVVVNGNSIMMEQDDTYDYATSSALNAKQDKLTGADGQIIQFNTSGNPVATDPIFITVNDIDAICGGSISYAEDVMF